MTRDEILEVVKRCIAESLALPATGISEGSRLIDDLGADSLDFVDIVFMLDRELDIRVRDTEFNFLTRLDFSSPEVMSGAHLTSPVVERLSSILPRHELDTRQERGDPTPALLAHYCRVDPSGVPARSRRASVGVDSVAMPQVLDVRAVSKRFGDVIALEDVSVALSGPRLVVILGPNGAGKTTLLDLLEGLTDPTSGTIVLFGRPVTPNDYPRRRVGVVMQREFVLDGVRVGDYADLFAAIYKTADGRARIVKRAGLVGRENVSVERLSGGEAQRLFIAAASVHEPDLLLLDEPTSGLDPEGKQRVGELLCEMARSALVVMTTHDLDEAGRLANDVLFLFDGRVRAHGTKAELLDKVGPDATLRDAFFRFCGRTISQKGEAL